jgi:hypothetical protein
MKRAFPSVIAIVATLAFVASFSEIQRMRTRFGEVIRHQFQSSGREGLDDQGRFG